MGTNAVSAFGKALGLAFGAAFGLVVTVPPVEVASGGGGERSTTVHPAYESRVPKLQAEVGRKDFAKLFDAREAPLSAASVDIPANPSGGSGSAGSVGTTGPDSGRIGHIAAPVSSPEGIPVSPVLGDTTTTHQSSNRPLAPVDTAQAAIDLVATKEPTTHGTETAQTVQTAQEGQQAPESDAVAANAAIVRAAREDEALAMILILMGAA